MSMKKLTEITSAKRKAESEIKKLEKHLEAARKKRNAISRQFPFVCRKCGIAYSIGEVGYKVYRTRCDHMDCQPMGDYDVRQDVYRQELACCPKCGHNFGKKVSPDEWIEETKTYGRWDDRPRADFKPCGTVCIDTKIRKVKKCHIAFLKKEFED